jgi:hypothetical protein
MHEVASACSRAPKERPHEVIVAIELTNATAERLAEHIRRLVD